MRRMSKTEIHFDVLLLLWSACYVPTSGRFMRQVKPKKTQTSGRFMRQLKQLFAGHVNWKHLITVAIVIIRQQPAKMTNTRLNEIFSSVSVFSPVFFWR
jgi:hypothetical protein